MAGNPLVPSFRFPAAIPDHEAPASVRQAITFLMNSAVDAQQAFQALGQGTPTQTASSAQRAAAASGGQLVVTTGGSSGGGSGATSFNFLTGVVSYFPSMGQVDNESGQTSYTIPGSDNGSVVVFDDASPIAVTLDPYTTPFFCFINNVGAGAATLTPSSGTINGGASFVVSGGGTLAVIWIDGSGNWWVSSGGVSSLDGITGAVTLVAGSNITISDNSPSAGHITIAASGGSAGYVKGTVSIGPVGGAGTYTGTGTVTGATVGSAVLVGVSNGTEAGYLSNLIGWVSAANTVTIQATFATSSLLLGLPVVVFV